MLIDDNADFPEWGAMDCRAVGELGYDHVAIIRLCRSPLAVAELSAHIGLPLGIVRELLGDFVDRGLLLAPEPHLATRPPVSTCTRR
jgi:hypothetical protein